MLVSITSASATGANESQVVEGSPHAVANYLKSGNKIGPVTFQQGDSPQFRSADWLFVSFNQSADIVLGVLTHPFTEWHVSLVCLSAKANGMTECLLGFCLPESITDSQHYRQILSGLSVIYGAVGPLTEVDGWQAGSNPVVDVSGHSLSTVVVERLLWLGQENQFHRSTGYIRSSVRLDQDIVVMCVDGEEVPLPSLDEGSRVFCPIHIDTIGTGTVIGRGNAKAVQCSCCMRNYWNVPKRGDADFGHFRRVFDALRAQEVAARIPLDKRQFVLLHSEYLPAMDLQPESLDFRMGFTLVRSPKGTGKTRALEHLLNECRLQGKSVLLIGHRRSLLGSLANRLKMDLYFESYQGDDGETEYQATRVSNRFAICLDSMPTRLKPERHKFDVVLVDESEQVIRHLTGETLKRARREAFLLFKHYLSAAQSVYMLDADMDMLSMSMVFEAAHPLAQVRILVNEPAVDLREYDLVTTRDGLMARLGEAVESGKKCYVATNSKRAAERIGLWIKQRWASKRVEVVTRDNAQTPAIQSLLTNIVAEYQEGMNGQPPLDILVGSPSIGTGIDITFPKNAVGVDHVFGLFEGGINTHHDIDQQLARVRHPGKVSVWINRNLLHYETDPAALRAELRSTVLHTDSLVGFTRDGFPIYSEMDKPMIDLWSEVLSHERTSKNTLFYQWLALREAAGWRAVIDSVDEEDKARGKRAIQEGRALSERARIERMISARDLDATEAEKLAELDRMGAVLNDDDRAALEKYRLGQFYAADVNVDLVLFDDDGRTRHQVEWLEILVGDQMFSRGIDRHEIDRKGEMRVIIFDRQYRCAKGEMLTNLLASAGLLDVRTGIFIVDAKVSTQTLGDFVACFKVNRKRIENQLRLDMRRDIDKKPVQQLSEVLALIGLGLEKAETKKCKGVKTRSYRLESSRLESLLEVVIRREQLRGKRRQQALADGEGASGDNFASISNREPGELLSPKESAIQPVPIELTTHLRNLLAAFSV